MFGGIKECCKFAIYAAELIAGACGIAIMALNKDEPKQVTDVPTNNDVPVDDTPIQTTGKVVQEGVEQPNS